MIESITIADQVFLIVLAAMLEKSLKISFLSTGLKIYLKGSCF